MTKKAKHLQRLQHQLARLERRLLVLRQHSDQFSRWRLILFVLAGLVSGGSFLQWGPIVWLWVTAVSLIPFIITIILHRRIETTIIRFAIWQQIKKTNIARMILAWDDLPAERPFPIPPDHPFATDIDIVGTFSLHRLLDTAVSHDGSQRLHSWLLSTNPQPETIAQRQKRVRELTGQTHFRQRLTLEATLATDQSGEQWAGQELVDWLKEGGSEKSLWPLLISLTGLAMFNWLLFAGYQLCLAMAAIMDWQHHCLRRVIHHPWLPAYRRAFCQRHVPHRPITTAKWRFFLFRAVALPQNACCAAALPAVFSCGRTAVCPH